MGIFSKKKDTTNPEIFLNLQPDLAQGHALMVVDKETGISEKITTNRYVIPALPRDVDENSDDYDERQKRVYFVPVSKDFLLRLDIGEHRKFLIGLPKRVEDLPLGLQNGVGKDLFGTFILLLNRKATIETLLRQDIKNKDQILKEVVSNEFYDDLLKHLKEIMKFHTESVVGRVSTANIPQQ